MITMLFSPVICVHMIEYKRRLSQQLLRSALKGERPALLAFLPSGWNTDMMAGVGAAILNYNMDLGMVEQ